MQNKSYCSYRRDKAKNLSDKKKNCNFGIQFSGNTSLPINIKNYLDIAESAKCKQLQNQ